jgi:rhombotail lipoprotein
MMFIRYSLFVLIAIILSSCSQGFDRGRLQKSSLPLQVNDPVIKETSELRPQLKFPMRLAVILLSEDTYRADWRWTEQDKEAFDKWGLELLKAGIVKSVFIIPSMFIPHDEDGRYQTIREYRRAAATHGADALLVVRGVSDVDSYLNPSSIFYLTIVGAFLVPGSHKDALFMIQGGLIDVNNGFVYASAEVEAEAKSMRPLALSESGHAIEPAKTKAIERFGTEMFRRINNLR